MNWDQLRTILWLRWRLTRNQWTRTGRFNAIITLIAVWVGLCMAVAAGIGSVLVGGLTLSKASPTVILFVWDGILGVFLLWWSIGVVAELQRSELIELGRFLHLPVSLRDVFLLNYVASHLSFSLAMVVPVALGLTAGLVFSRSVAMILLLPMLAGFLFMVTAWTYCLREWLASIMVNQRRRRTIIMALTLALVLGGQLPNLVVSAWQRGGRRGPQAQQAHREKEAQAKAVGKIAHRAVPFLWLPLGAKALAEGRVWPALLASAGMMGLGAIGLRRAYRATLRFYQGQTEAKAAKPPATVQPDRPRGQILVEKHLPLVPPEAGAMALASFRSMTRAPEVKMAMSMNIVMVLVMATAALFRGSSRIPDEVRPFLVTGAVGMTFLGMMQVMFNTFGFDRDGFRALVLLPTRRELMLLGKTLAILPLAVGVFVVLLALLTILAKPPLLAVVAACVQFGAAYMGFGALGNFLSITIPYRIAAGSLKPTKTTALTTLLIIVSQMFFPLAILPILVPPGLGVLCAHFGWLPGAPVNLLCSLVLLAVLAAVYRLTLNPLGKLLQSREQRILQVVTQEVE
ncbi:MAG: hypothetical protein HZA90_18825 [Verrucomicrobia bacterium]|nr:hypothetical protein [Verrucomicrobiota bacterium]